MGPVFWKEQSLKELKIRAFPPRQIELPQPVTGTSVLSSVSYLNSSSRVLVAIRKFSH